MHSIPPPIDEVQILKNLLHLELNIRLPTIRGTRQAKEAITRTQIWAQIFNQCKMWRQMALILRILRARAAPLLCKSDTILKSSRCSEIIILTKALKTLKPEVVPMAEASMFTKETISLLGRAAIHWCRDRIRRVRDSSKTKEMVNLT